MILLILEAIVVGILLVLVSTIIMTALHYISPEKNYYVATFIIGAVFHLLCEGAGLNKWYCNNSYACS